MVQELRNSWDFVLNLAGQGQVFRITHQGQKGSLQTAWRAQDRADKPSGC